MFERPPRTNRDGEQELEVERETAQPTVARKVEQRRDEQESEAPSLDEAIVQAKLTVGPAGDAYEREADAVAARVVETLRSPEPALAAAPVATESRVQRSEYVAELGDDGGGEGGDNSDDESVDVGGGRKIRRCASGLPAPIAPAATIRRIQRSATAPEVGLAGGDLDSDTSRKIDSARSGGSSLPKHAKSAMESAFGADFSGVRVHSGSTSTELNDRIQAKAFTTGQDIFFRDKVPDVSTTSGQELLAHELTHTIQQGAAVQRSSVIMRRWWPFGKKKGGSKMEIGAPTNASLNGGDVDTELAKQGFHPEPLENPQIGQPEPAVPAGPYTGPATKQTSATEEAAKPAGAVTLSGGAALTSGLGHGGGEMNVPVAGGGAAGALGILTVGDGVMGVRNAKKMKQDGTEHGDDAMLTMAADKRDDQLTQVASGVANTVKGGASLGAGGVGAGSAGAMAVMATTAGVSSVVVGGVAVLQGSWRGGKAVMNLCHLTYGRAQNMLSADGERWKEVFVTAEKWKAAINAFKVVAGGLGVAAGLLVLAGSPVGWILALSAAIAGGMYAVAKAGSKVSNAREKSNAREADAAQSEISAPYGTSSLQDVGGSYQQGYVDLGAKGYDMSKMRKAGPQNEPDRGTGLAKEPAEPQRDDTKEREAAIAEADRLAALGSKNAQIAAEVRAALSRGDGEFFMAAMEAAQANPHTSISDMITNPDDMRLHDAFVLLSSVGIDPDEALAASGQTLIEHRLSSAEAM